VLLAAWAPGSAAETEQEVQQLYREAYRYQVGSGRPQNIRKAVELYEAVIRMDPSHVDAHYNLAGLCAVQMRYDLAVDHYRKVLKLRPRDADACNNLGTLLERQGLSRKARIAYNRAIRLNPRVAAAHYNLGRLLLKDGDDQKAAIHIGKALELEPENPDYVSMQSKILGEAGKISNLVVGVVVVGFIGVLAGYAVFVRKRGAKV